MKLKSSYSENDVEILLKDITGMVTPLPASEREKYIQSGVHYCEMLPLEYRPSEKYMEAYYDALKNYSGHTALAVSVLSEKIIKEKKNPVIVSLARAGIPIGILIKRYIKNKYKIDIKHYAISIIRGRGIDKNAVNYILERHNSNDIQFIDGWIGKGAILSQLKAALAEYPQLSTKLGVLSDPAGLTELCGTHEDILIPSSCLNSTVTGLLSRTFLRSDIISDKDFHGAAFYSELAEEDLSEQFLCAIEEKFVYGLPAESFLYDDCICGTDVVDSIAKEYEIENINYIKPGIGEATRVLLRRIPWKILINDKYNNSDELKHIYRLADEKNIPCEISRVPLGNYKVCGIIRKLSDI